MLFYIFPIFAILVVISAHSAISEINSQEVAQQFTDAEISAPQLVSENDQQDTEERCATEGEEEFPFFMRQVPDLTQQTFPNVKTRTEEHKMKNSPDTENLEKVFDALINPEHILDETPIQQKMKSAQPHFHSGYHSHEHSHFHPGKYEKNLRPTINLNINQNQQVHSPKHYPETHHNHFQQNQQLHSSNFNYNNQFHGAHQNQQFHKSVHHGTFNPTHEEFFASQNQQIFRNNPETSLVRESSYHDALNFVPTNNQAMPKWTTSISSDEVESGLLREANSPFDKIKNKKYTSKIYAPQYYSNYHYGSHMDADQSKQKPSFKNVEVEIVKSPHLKQKRKMKKIHTMFLYPAYNSGYQSYSPGFYRSTDDNQFDEIIASPHFLNDEKMETLYLYPIPHDNYQHDKYSDALDDNFLGDSFREANPDPHKFKHKKFKKMSHYPKYYSGYGNLYKEAETKESENLLSTEDKLTSPFLFDVQSRTRSEQYKRSVNKSLKPKNIYKRSIIPLHRLLNDPNVKLNIPKTIENFGTATKHAVEDDKAPIYHLKHLIGSSKNAILSALKVAPQNLIIPTNYLIVKDEDSIVGSAKSEGTPEFPEFSRTFTRLGEIIRDSIRSGQETAEHINNVAYQARNIIHSAKHATPRFVLPYSKIPALEDIRFKTPQKAVLITPRVFDLAEEANNLAETKPDFVKLSHIMDAAGFSNPNSTPLDLQKIIFEPHSLTDTSVSKTLENMQDRLNEEEIVGTAVGALENAKVSVGAKNLRDFLLKMKNELSDYAHPKETKTKRKLLSEDKHERKKEIDKFIDTLFDGKKKADFKRENEEEEVVGSDLYLSPDLLHPFMNRASKSELHDFLKDNGDLDDESTVDDSIVGENNNQENKNEFLLGAINPLMLERMAGKTISPKGSNSGLEKLGSKFENTSENQNVGTSMTLTDIMLKPFMGASPGDLKSRAADDRNMNHENFGQLSE